MARAYRRWLIAKGNVFCPSGEAIAQLVARFQKEGWIDGAGVATWSIDADEAPGSGTAKLPTPLDPAWIDDPARSDLVLSWPAARSPLVASDGAHPTDVKLQIHRGEDFVYPNGKGVGRIETECDCGEDLGFAWDPDEVVPPFGDAIGIFTECSECSRTFDPALSEAEITDPATGRKTSVRGGAAHRFALVVTASLADGAAPTIAPDLAASYAAEFNRSFYEVGALD